MSTSNLSGPDPDKIVAYLGPRASYTHQVALENLGDREYILQPRTSIQDIFTAVQSHAAAYGVVPFENSTNGSVVQTLDLFADRELHYPDIYVCAEAYLDVHHDLLGFLPVHPPNQPYHANPSTPLPTDEYLHDSTGSGDCTPTNRKPTPMKPRTKPLTNLKHVKTIYSHPQAFGQCEAFLSTYLKGVERVEVSSTSKAAQLVAVDGSASVAAISSRVAGGVHGLEALARGIEDRDDNTTRFFVLGRGRGCGIGMVGPPSVSVEGATEGGERDGGDAAEEDYKSFVSFTIDHREAGALADALLVFKTHGFTLTSINSRPSRSKPWHYIFFVEFEGERGRGGTGEVVDGMLETLGSITHGWRYHGSWKRRDGAREVKVSS